MSGLVSLFLLMFKRNGVCRSIVDVELISKKQRCGVGVGAGVVATSQESESIKLPRLRLRNMLFESVMQFAYAGEILHALFENDLCRYRLKILLVYIIPIYTPRA